MALGELAQSSPLVGVGQAESGGEALIDGVVAARARKDEGDRREHLLVGEALDHLGAPRRVQPAAALAAPRDVARVEAGRRRIRMGLTAVVHERRQQVHRR